MARKIAVLALICSVLVGLAFAEASLKSNVPAGAPEGQVEIVNNEVVGAPELIHLGMKMMASLWLGRGRPRPRRGVLRLGRKHRFSSYCSKQKCCFHP
ncbi:hypothetical protein Nepgr_027932 [Nepenthes gracilis]|uniref:Uncharacterized protein n=1 Tax=Nepenthes gracilis TaxID=150966 RepID=A0AAD3TBV2_NEPGR|nr:hypothetical protein Nepgr_027932 [Nepenthes gracilis]